MELQSWTRSPQRECYQNIFATCVLFCGCVACCWECDLIKVTRLTPEKATHPVVASVPSEKVGILMVSHGADSPAWQRLMRDFHESVSPELLAVPGIDGVKTSFMERAAPSIANELRRFDEEGFTHVIMVPLLLSSHSFDDIASLIGVEEDRNALALLQAEGIERYTPKATVGVAQLRDLSRLVSEKRMRRTEGLSGTSPAEQVLLVTYGGESELRKWQGFLDRINE